MKLQPSLVFFGTHAAGATCGTGTWHLVDSAGNPRELHLSAIHPKQHGTMEKQHDKTSRRPSNILAVKWYLLRSLKQCVSGWANQCPCSHREDIIQNKCKHEVVVAYTFFKHRIELKGGCSGTLLLQFHTYTLQTNQPDLCLLRECYIILVCLIIRKCTLSTSRRCYWKMLPPLVWI